MKVVCKVEVMVVVLMFSVGMVMCCWMVGVKMIWGMLRFVEMVLLE